MLQRRDIHVLACMLLMVAAGCGGAEGKSEAETAAQTTPAAPVYRKVTQVSMDPAVNTELAAKGEKIFNVICSACHKYDSKYVGPALGDIYTRRTPEYIMNMILDTDYMLERDDTARCLLQTYLVRMPNAQVNEADARSVVEHFRAYAEKK